MLHAGNHLMLEINVTETLLQRTILPNQTTTFLQRCGNVMC